MTSLISTTKYEDSLPIICGAVSARSLAAEIVRAVPSLGVNNQRDDGIFVADIGALTINWCVIAAQWASCAPFFFTNFAYGRQEAARRLVDIYDQLGAAAQALGITVDSISDGQVDSSAASTIETGRVCNVDELFG